MEGGKDEGKDPQAQQAAEEWRKRFDREGHEGSYAPHPDGEKAAPTPGDPAAQPSRTSSSD